MSTNSSTSNGTDIYSTTSRLSKAVTATASAFINNTDQNSDPLLSSSSYKQAMREALNSKNSLALQRRRHQTNSYQTDPFGNHFTSSSEYFKNAFKSSKTAYKLLTHIPDELLDDIPDEPGKNSATSISLFQGFNAALPAIDEEIELSKNLEKGDDILKKLTNRPSEEDEEELKFRTPGGVTKEKINETYSTSKLTSYKQSINNNLDLLEIRKNLAASEIAEIDSKISKLQNLRNTVFKRVATLEQNELFLENHIQDIDDRIQMIKEFDMEKEDSDSDLNVENGNSDKKLQNEAKDSVNVENESDSAEETENNNEPLISQSIYGKLQKNPPRFRKKIHRSRKTTPTLQQYYEPGTAIRTIRAHEDSITCFDFDMPFGTLVTASLDNTVRVWDLSKGKNLGLLEGHNAPVSSIQMDDTIAVTGSLDATLKLWDLSKLEQGHDPLVHSFESHIEEITAFSFHNYNMVSGSQDRTLRQWDLQTGHCLQTIDILWATQMNNSINLESSLVTDRTRPFIGALQVYDAALATGTSDGIVRLWDLRSGEVVRTLVGHTGPVNCLQFDDKHLATGSSDRSIRIWDLRTGGIHDAFAYESPISSLQFDSRRIVSSNNEDTAKIYDRIEEKHSSCGGKESDSAIINYVRYREGYLVEGRSDGKVGIWAI